MSMQPKFGEVAQKILCKRYLVNLAGAGKCPHCGKEHETPEEMIQRVSFGNSDYYEMLCNLDFLPNSPTLFNAETGQGTSSACFKFDVEDSMVSIMDVATKSAFVQKWGGGVGYCLSALRPYGAPIKSTHGKACGPIAVLYLYHAVALMITQGGKREGAQMGILHCDHGDIEEFIKCKGKDLNTFSTFNLSVACTDSFMRNAVNEPGSREYELLWMIAGEAWKTGDPGLYFIDQAERCNPTPHLGKLTGTNPCGEVPLLDNEPCNLGSINLSHFVIGIGNTATFDFDRLEKVARLATRYLDEVLDRNIFPIEAVEFAALKTRKLGLGVMGWADALALMHIHYDTIQAIELADKIMRTIDEAAKDESRVLAEEKGECPAFDGIGTSYPRRNAAVTCIAPAGTLSKLAGCSSGIEPHFTLKGKYIMGDGTEIEEVASVMSVLGTFVPKTAHEINWDWHVKHQAAFQEHTDLAVSKTINLPESATVQDIFNAYVMAWQSGCKGTTVYRNKSRANQVIVSGDKDIAIAPAKSTRRKLARECQSIRHHFVVGGTEGYMHVGLFDDNEPGEIFLKISKQGSTIDGLLDAIAILTSLSLQHGVPLGTLVSKFKGVRFEPSGLTDSPDLPKATSLLDYIFRYLGRKFLDGIRSSSETGMICPECGMLVISESGCLHCTNSDCDWSMC